MNAKSPSIEAPPVLLVVDDQPDNLSLLGELLTLLYRVRIANSGERALALVRTPPKPDLILLDVMMPGMDGYAVLDALRRDISLAEVPVIFLTALDGSVDEEKGLALGAIDYIAKPIRPAVVLARVKTHLTLKQMRDALVGRNSLLEEEVERRMQENQRIQDVSILALAHLAETRDSATGNHLRRTKEYIAILANHLLAHGYADDTLTPHSVRLLVKSAVLHDIGKVGVPDYILLKPGRLDADEWKIMQRHAQLGAEAIELAEREAEQPVAFLALAKQIARWHHERWDGTGYPDGLKGRDIPLAARLMALADVFDALISHRVYKMAIPAAEARVMILAASGSHFDPDIVDAFDRNFDHFVAVAERYGDDSGQVETPEHR
ncbi:HD-GYP domain-containing protein [Paludibacterium purpuratum]|uniref:Putative two-component system response regulator n=1 Tax=Paludibacterium purpuratum TaxID=1144873 RepID=A0A4R7B9D5_9NEIS|nr:HD domain-containing phosphohydrolase [Paludibacterium purpuratum]TDR81500.1 putative two-component system response regulator [Paludibacterium purpuratum]